MPENTLPNEKKSNKWDEPAFDTSNMTPAERFFCPTRLEYEIASEMVDDDLKRNKGSY